MTTEKLTVGRIDYLNIWPVFQSIKDDQVVDEITFVSGHPSLLNNGLYEGAIDAAPSSSFEYLIRAEKYMLVPNLGISAENEVKSVLFCLPFSFDRLESYVLDGGCVRLTGASAASAALIRVLWQFCWKLPEPIWVPADPGSSLGSGEPFLEIGDHALSVYQSPGSDLHIVDLASEWKKFTGLPFVFALWIINRNISHARLDILQRLSVSLNRAVNMMPGRIQELAELYPATRFSPDTIKSYWETIDFRLGPDHLAGLAAFGRYLTRLNQITGMPVLDFCSSLSC